MNIEEKHIVAAHAEIHTIRVIDIDPDHGDREESPDLERLKKDLRQTVSIIATFAKAQKIYSRTTWLVNISLGPL